MYKHRKNIYGALFAACPLTNHKHSSRFVIFSTSYNRVPVCEVMSCDDPFQIRIWRNLRFENSISDNHLPNFCNGSDLIICKHEWHRWNKLCRLAPMYSIWAYIFPIMHFKCLTPGDHSYRSVRGREIRWSLVKWEKNTDWSHGSLWFQQHSRWPSFEFPMSPPPPSPFIVYLLRCPQLEIRWLSNHCSIAEFL